MVDYLEWWIDYLLTHTIALVPGGIWPLVGRDRELALAREALRGSTASRGVVLTGGSGVGKTRLAREIAAESHRVETVVRWATGTPVAQAIPLGVFSEFIGDISGNPAQVLRRARSALLRTTGKGALILCVDDAHLLDDLSAELVMQLALHDAAAVVVTVRTGELQPEPIAALWSQGLLPRLEVPALTDAQAAILIETVLGGRVEERTSRRLRSLARGNVLFLRQVIDGELDAGRLVRSDERWTWHGHFVPSTGLTDLISQRLGRLPAHELDVVDLLAVAGPLDLSTLTRLCPTEAIEGCERAAIVESSRRDGAVTVAPAHPLFAEVRRARLGEMTARRLRGRVIEALDPPSAIPGALVRYALLLVDSDRGADASLLTRAARAAVQLLDWDLAERLVRAAIAAGAGRDAEYVLAHVLSFTGHSVAADESLADLIAACPQGPLRTELVMSRAAHQFWMLGRPDAGLDLVRTEIATTGEPDARHQLSAMLAMFEVCAGQADTATRRVAELDDRACDRMPVAALCRTWARTSTAAVTGQIDRCAGVSMDGYRRAGEAFQLGQPRIGMASHLVLGLVSAGRLADADRVAEEVTDDVDPGLPYPELTTMAIRAVVDVAAGRVRSGLDLAGAAIEGLQRVHESEGWIAQACIPLAVSAALLGERDRAATAVALIQRHRHPAHRILDPDLRLAEAWVAACEGATSDAVALATDAADIARRQGQPATEIIAHHTLVRLGHRPDVARITTLAASQTGPRAAAIVAHAAAVSAHDGDRLSAAAGQLEQFGDVVSAIDAAAQAAQAYRSAGRAGSALGARQLVRRLRSQCGGVTTPAVLDLSSTVAPLTRREHEVVTLAADGLTNRAIASRLVLSVRTVEGHLYRAGAKLGVTRREQYGLLITGRQRPDT